MSSIDEKIVQAQEKVMHLKRQKRIEENQKKEYQRRIDDRRKFIIGELVVKYFPEVLNFQPRRTAEENKDEFASLENFLSTLATEKDYITQLKAKGSKQSFPNSQK